MKYIAFVCGHNTGRSQMAMGIFNHLKVLYPSVDEAYMAVSFGTGIGTEVNPKIIAPMREIDIDVTDTDIYFPKDIEHPSIKEYLPGIKRFYTMGCMEKDVCELPGGQQITGDWDLADPAKDDVDVLAVREQIFENTLELIVELNSRL